MFLLDSVSIKFLSSTEIEKCIPFTLCVSRDSVENDKQLTHSSLGSYLDIVCNVCSKGQQFCPGHCGKLQLRYPIINPMRLDFLSKILLHICFECNIFNHNEVVLDSDEHNKEYTNIKFTRCSNCSISLNKTINVIKLSNSKDTVNYYGITIKSNNKSKNWDVQDLTNMFFNFTSDIRAHLDSKFDLTTIIMDYIIVAPSCVRVIPSDDEHHIDNLAAQYNEIMLSMADEKLLINRYKYCNTIHSKYNILLGLSDSKKQYLKQKLTGKSGFYRKFALGKRVDFCARSVISPDISIAIDEIGIPRSLANDLAKYDEDDIPIPIKDGDYIMINRQPTLSKSSILFVKAKIYDSGYTLKLNPITVTPLNGDFDGDEISIYSIVTNDAVNEVSEKLSLSKNIIYNNKLIIGLDQNTISGLYILSTCYKVYDISRIPNLSEVLRRYRSSKYPIYYDTNMIISSALPKGFCYNKYGVHIDNGIYVKGELNKSVLWTTKHSILYMIHLIYGYENYLRLVKNIQDVVNEWLSKYGLTIGLQECIMDRKPLKAIENSINFKQQSEKLALETMPKKGLYNIVKSGSKGDMNNIGQILAAVGQQYSDGEIMPVSDIVHPNNLSSTCIKSSYTSGLSADELFIHSKVGREGIIRTAVSTADIGYGQRTLVKLLEGITINNSLNVIEDFDNSIIEFNDTTRQDTELTENELEDLCRSIINW